MKSKLTFCLSLFLLFLVISSCDDKNVASGSDTLLVKFSNSTNSEYTITKIELRAMGEVDKENEPIGSWGSNLLSGGMTLAPGESTNFTLNIPNGHWSQYRVYVDDGGTSVLVNDETMGFGGEFPITHWGADDRSVSITIKYYTTGDVIYASAYGDWAGIED